MNDYDIREAFEEMELELIASMRRNLAKHQKWEKAEGMNWTMWQAEQLKTLENFKKENKKLFGKKFSSINAEIANFLTQTYKVSGFKQERAILDQLAKGNKVKSSLSQGLEGGFFSLNEDKMNALIKATTKDMEKAEHAMLRMVNDQYRKTIFNAQVMANSGAFTLQQSIDKATKDFLRAGINCIQYKDGRRVNIASYAEMAIRTANKRAKLVSEGDVRKAYDVHTVRVSKYGQCSKTCLPWQGRVYVDDVYSGGTKKEAKEKNLPLLSEAIEGGLFHPNCKHTMTTYFYDIKKALGKLQEDGAENPLEEQEHRKNKLHIQQQKRLETGSLDPVNVEQAKEMKEKWIEKDEKIIEISDKHFKESKINGKINIEIDELTPCLRRLSDNEFIDTTFKVGTPSAIKLKDWEFDWSFEEDKGFKVSQLFVKGDKRIQGLIATKPRKDLLAIEVDIVESAPFNNPHNKLFKKKEYAGIGGHLFAEAVRQSYEEGFDGFVVFKAKSNLVKYYEKEIGAILFNPRDRMMCIDERGAKILYERYFKK